MMIRQFLAIILLFMLAIGFLSEAISSEKGKRYKFEKAMIVMEKKTIHPGVEVTTMDTLYIDRWGEREVKRSREIRNIKMTKKTEESRSVSIMEGEWITSYDQDTREGTRMKNPFYGTLGKLSESEQQKFADDIAGAFKAKTKNLPDEKVAEKMCKVTETSTGIQGMSTTTRTWIWNGFVLKNVSKGMGVETMEGAKSVEERVGIPANLLLVPKDVKIKVFGKQ